MKSKRALAMIMACLMSVSLLGGCGGAGAESSKASEGSKADSKPESSMGSESKADADSSASEESEEGKESEGGDSEFEYAEISVEVFDRGTDGGKTDPTDNNWTDWIQKKVLEDLNIGVTFVPVPRSEETAGLNNLLAAGTAPDICMTYDSGLITNLQLQGGLIDIAPYVDSLLPDYKELLGPDLALPGHDFIYRGLEKETGELFYLPQRRFNTAMRNIFIRKDWLDALGLPEPTTPETYFDALVAFKEQDPGGVGADKVVPFTLTADSRWTAGNIIESFIDPDLSEKDDWINSGVRSFTKPGYKEGVRFMNKMYNAGLVDREFPLYSNTDTMDSLVKSGVVGSLSANWDQIFRDETNLLTDLQKNVPEAEMIAIDPMVSSDGVTHKGAYDAIGIKYFIPVTSESPEAAMRYLNWLSLYENYYFLQWGPEGTVHEMVDGVPKLIGETGAWIQNSGQNLDYTLPVQNPAFSMDPIVNAKAIANGYSVDPAIIEEAYNVSMQNAKPGPVIPATINSEATYSQILVEKGDTLLIESITASEADFDKVWDDGLADWLASGGQEIIDERTEKYFDPAA